MFKFFKRPSKSELTSDALAEFEKRRRELYDKFAVEDTPYDELLDAMSAVEYEMNHVGGGNWTRETHGEYLVIIQDHLRSDPQFSPAQIQSIDWALNEVAACGDELARNGESSRALEEPINYLVARVVDFCRTHEPESPNDP